MDAEKIKAAIVAELERQDEEGGPICVVSVGEFVHIDGSINLDRLVSAIVEAIAPVKDWRDHVYRPKMITDKPT